MVIIEIYGWRTGLMKISHTNLLQKYAGMGLGIAHRSTNALLDGTPLRFEVADQSTAEAVITEFTAVGANARILQSIEPAP